MKLTNVTALLFSAAAGVFTLASAQQTEQPAGPRLSAVVQLKNSKSNKLSALTLVPPTNMAKGVFAYITSDNPEQPVERSTKEFKVFLVTTPPELVVAARAYADGSLSTAARQLGSVRSKYMPFVALPDNPTQKAAWMELNCYARLQDWAGLGKLAAAFPGAEFLSSQDRLVLEAARILSHVSDDPTTAASRQKEVEAFLGNSSNKKRLTPTAYAWIKYAQARAASGAFTEDMLKNGIPEAKAAAATQAVDALCEAAMATRGRDMELPLDAMKRAFAIMWAMPGVKSYSNTAKKMDKKVWESAPIDFREAVSLAYMIQNIFEPDCKDDNIRKAASFFFNAQKGKKSAEAKK
ncbi:MAG: hypothetical protein J1E42_07110 [Akkermansiaceae bacterium]|nr:hypothetical protein [Akkermansiaceae bacterium]